MLDSVHSTCSFCQSTSLELVCTTHKVAALPNPILRVSGSLKHWQASAWNSHWLLLVLHSVVMQWVGCMDWRILCRASSSAAQTGAARLNTLTFLHSVPLDVIYLQGSLTHTGEQSTG